MNGPIPDGMLACHHCDNPPCVNPAHLFLGNNAQNLCDMAAKGRAGHVRSVLTAADVEAIRRRVLSGEQQKDVAAFYGINSGHVSRIVSRKARVWQ